MNTEAISNMKTLYTDEEFLVYTTEAAVNDNGEAIGYYFPDGKVKDDDGNTVETHPEVNMVHIEREDNEREIAYQALTKVKNDDIRKVLAYLMK